MKFLCKIGGMSIYKHGNLKIKYLGYTTIVNDCINSNLTIVNVDSRVDIFLTFNSFGGNGIPDINYKYDSKTDEWEAWRIEF